jgi:hypothetical protein
MSQRGTQGTQGTVSDISFFIDRDIGTYPVGVEKIFEVIQNAALRPLRPPQLVWTTGTAARSQPTDVPNFLAR